MGAIGRACTVVNLDPANDHTSYQCGLDIRELVKLEDVMKDEGLGPNGGMLYSLEALEVDFDWLEEKLKEFGEDYILFDCPGQVELYTHHDSLRNVFEKLQKIGYRLVVVHLSDSFCLTQPSLYISNLLLTLRGMLQMSLPQINVLSKIDNIGTYDPLPFNLDFYTDVDSLSYLMPFLESENPTRRSNKFGRLNEAVAGIVESHSLVRYEVLAVENKKSMMHLLRVIDRAGGYVFGGAEGANDTIWQVAMRSEGSMMEDYDLQGRWIDNKEEYDAQEKKEEEEYAQMMADMAEEEAPADDELDLLSVPPKVDNNIKVVRKNK
jgi:hypothetical protein